MVPLQPGGRSGSGIGSSGQGVSIGVTVAGSGSVPLHPSGTQRKISCQKGLVGRFPVENQPGVQVKVRLPVVRRAPVQPVSG